MSTLHAVVVTASDRPGMMSAVTKVLADHQANIRYVDLHSGGDHADIYFEFALDHAPDSLFADLQHLDGVLRLEEIPSFAKIYGKRIVVMGGGAQVGQVALGAIAEADRHNIRGERISVDTIPLVGEDALAAAVRDGGECDGGSSRHSGASEQPAGCGPGLMLCLSLELCRRQGPLQPAIPNSLFNSLPARHNFV